MKKDIICKLLSAIMVVIISFGSVVFATDDNDFYQSKMVDYKKSIDLASDIFMANKDALSKLIKENKTSEIAIKAADMMKKSYTFNVLEKNIQNQFIGEVSLNLEDIKFAILNEKEMMKFLKTANANFSENLSLAIMYDGGNALKGYSVNLDISALKYIQSSGVKSFTIYGDRLGLLIDVDKYLSKVNEDAGFITIILEETNEYLPRFATNLIGNMDAIIVKNYVNGEVIPGGLPLGAVTLQIQTAIYDGIDFNKNNYFTFTEIGAPIRSEAYNYNKEKKIMQIAIVDNGYVLLLPQISDITFNDINADHWARSYITELVNLKVLSGIGDNKFQPEGNITREQFAKMLVAAFGLYDSDATADFSDVNIDAWYYPYLASAVKSGIVKGIGGGAFGTGAVISRQDMAVMVVRVMELKGIPFKELAQEMNFTDGGKIESYAMDSIKIMQKAQIINGFEDGSFDPTSPATRSQAAKIICMAK